jgi:UDP-glucose 4-epimerase
LETVLVTGGAGFIGSYIVDDLLAHDYRVIIVDDLSAGSVKTSTPKPPFTSWIFAHRNLVLSSLKKR